MYKYDNNKIARIILDNIEYPDLKKYNYGDDPYLYTINFNNSLGTKTLILHIQDLFDKLIGTENGTAINNQEIYNIFDKTSVEDCDKLFRYINKQSKSIKFFEFADFLIYKLDKNILKEIMSCIIKQDDELEETQTELEEVHDELEETQTELEEVYDELEEVHDELEETQTELEKVHDELEETQTELEKVHDELEETQTELEEVYDELEETQTELKEVHDELEETQTELEEVQDEQEETRTELEEPLNEQQLVRLDSPCPELEECSKVTNDKRDIDNKSWFTKFIENICNYLKDLFK